MFASSQITCCTQAVAQKSHCRAVFILMVAMRACLAAGLAGLLCKLQSKAKLGLLAILWERWWRRSAEVCRHGKHRFLLINSE